MLLGAIEAGGTKFVCATGAENGKLATEFRSPRQPPLKP